MMLTNGHGQVLNRPQEAAHGFNYGKTSLRLPSGCPGVLSASIGRGTEQAPYLFKNCTSLTAVGLSNALDLYFAKEMFYGANNLTSVEGIGNLYSLVNSWTMFRDCSAMTSEGTLKWYSVTSCRGTFMCCYSLSGFTDVVMPLAKDCIQMFQSCKSLQTFDMSTMSSVTATTQMFQNCSSLTGRISDYTATLYSLDAPVARSENTGKRRNMFNRCTEMSDYNDFYDSTDPVVYSWVR